LEGNDASDARKRAAYVDIPSVAHAPHRALLVPPAHHLLGTATVSCNDFWGVDHGEMQAYRISRFGTVDGIELRSVDDPRPEISPVITVPARDGAAAVIDRTTAVTKRRIVVLSALATPPAGMEQGLTLFPPRRIDAREPQSGRGAEPLFSRSNELCAD